MTDLHFWLFLLVGGSAVAAAVGMLLLRNAVYSALCLIYIMAALALLFLMLDAPFLALVQVTVYAGAVMVLFLFVMMLLGNQVISASEREIRGLPIIASIGATIFILAAGLAIQSGDVDSASSAAPPPAPQLRVVHFNQSNADESGASLRVDGLRIATDFGYGVVSEYQTLAPGAHAVALVAADGALLYEESVSLAGGEAVTLLIYPGEQNDAAMTASRVVEDFSHVGLRESRVAIVNLSGGALSVYDTGSDRALDMARDPLWVDELANGAASEPRLTERGRIDLALVNSATGETLLRTPGLELAGGASALLVIANDGAARTVWRQYSLDTADPFGSPAAVGQSLFRRFLLPFEMVGVLLLAALVGGIIISQGQRRDVRRRDVRRRVARTLAAAIDAQTTGESAAQLPAAEGDEAQERGGRKMGAIQVEHYLMLSAVLFTLGVLGVLLRRNAILIFMSVELMLNAANLALVAFARHWGQSDGHVFVFFVVTVAAAEVAVGLALLVTIFRTRQSINIDELRLLEG